MTNQVTGSTALQCSVLVLNKAYIPIHVISARRSIILLYRELAEVVHVEDEIYNNFDFETWMDYSNFLSEEKKEGEDWLRGIGFELMVPRVVRLYRYDRVPKQSLRFNRRNLFARDEHSCQYCGKTFPTNQLSFDHVIPKSRGGGTNWSNVVCCCLKCNTSKGNRTPSEANMTLTRKPAKPFFSPMFFSPMLNVKMESPKYKIWNLFVQSGKHHHTVSDRELVHNDG